MNSDSPLTPREELEARLTALLHAEMARLHDRLKQTLGLVRAAGTTPVQESGTRPDGLKLSAERREQLLAAFKTVRPRELQRAERSRVNGHEWLAVAAMIVALLAAGAFVAGQFNSRKGRMGSKELALQSGRRGAGAEWSPKQDLEKRDADPALAVGRSQNEPVPALQQP